MEFIDEALIIVEAGSGGRGCVSFRRERFIPLGGPDGGDGGKGGDVIIKAVSKKRTLQHFRHKKKFKAQNATSGQGRQKTGRNGKDLLIEVPCGTIVIDADTNDVMYDLVVPDEFRIVAKGGRGGQGNRRFRTSKNRVPRFAQPGVPGQTLSLKFELKLIADVGIIGLPNAGKSTLISTISSAKPKVAQYPFTTLTPNLGVVQTKFSEPFAVADIPGLIKGAHKGVGLGIRFLRHIERTKILVHLIDASTIDINNPLDDYNTILHELACYSDKLASKTQLIVLSKLDITGASEGAKAFRAAVNKKDVLLISAATQKGIEKFKSELETMLSEIV